jgi:hypothetical protein
MIILPFSGLKLAPGLKTLFSAAGVEMLKLPSQKPDSEVEFSTRIVAMPLRASKTAVSSTWKTEDMLKNCPETL